MYAPQSRGRPPRKPSARPIDWPPEPPAWPPRQPLPPRRRSRWGLLPGRTGVYIVFAGALLGLFATIVVGSDPGPLLGGFLIAATFIASLAVRAKAAHLVIPAPALAYLATSLIAGLVNDRAVVVTRTALLLGALQWVASGFLSITIATLIAIAFTTVRRRRARAPRREPPREQWR